MCVRRAWVLRRGEGSEGGAKRACVDKEKGVLAGTRQWRQHQRGRRRGCKESTELGKSSKHGRGAGWEDRCGNQCRLSTCHGEVDVGRLVRRHHVVVLHLPPPREVNFLPRLFPKTDNTVDALFRCFFSNGVVRDIILIIQVVTIFIICHQEGQAMRTWMRRVPGCILMRGILLPERQGKTRGMDLRWRPWGYPNCGLQ